MLSHTRNLPLPPHTVVLPKLLEHVFFFNPRVADDASTSKASATNDLLCCVQMGRTHISIRITAVEMNKVIPRFEQIFASTS